MKKIFIIIALISAFGYAQAQDSIVLSGKELFGSISARQIGPALMSGRITDLVGHPTNDKVLYVGAAGGGIWRSVDGGSSFNSIFDKHTQSIGALAIDPKNPDMVIWAGTGETWTRNSTSVGDGLYKTTDGGSNWKKVGFDGTDLRISSIQINPNNTDEVYVGVLGPLWGDSDERGVYKTTDGGATWEKLLAGKSNVGCSDLILDPNDSNILYAAFWEFRRTAWSFNSGGANSALYKSTDAGKSWNKIHNGFPKGDLGRFAIALAPSNSAILYAAVEAKEGKGLYKSADGGKSWEYLNKDFGLVIRPFYFSRIVVDPRNPDILMKGGLYGSMSQDGGKTFKSMGSMHADIHDYWFDINNSERVYAATDGGLYRSWNRGTTMEMVNDLPLSQFYHISVDNAEPYNIYGGLQDNGSWYGPSSSPGGIEARDWNRVGYGDGFRVYRHPTKKIIYSEMQGAQGVWRYNVDQNRTSDIKPFQEEGQPKLRFNWNAAMALSPNNPDRFYLASQFLHKSDDMGSNWKIISPDLTTNDPAKQNQEESGGISQDNSGAENHCTIFTVSESPLDENIIWVGTDDGNVQVTQDGGANWTNVIANIPNLPKNTWCYQVAASNFTKGAAYAVFEGHTSNDNTTYLYKTTDFGKTWVSLVKDNIDGFARSIQEDYESEDLLFLGTEFGLYATIDGGAHWSKFTNNMPATAVHSIALHRKTSDLVLGTHGRGVIIIDNISPLRALSQEVLRKDVHFFDAKPYVMKEESSFGGGSNGSQFIGRNPSRSAQIVYYLKKRHTFGKMTIEIQDANGNKVTSIDAVKQKGINIVKWNYNMKAPKVAKAKTFSFGGFASPRVPAGTYKVVMTKGKKSYSKDIEVEYDPKSGLTAEDRKLQQETIMKLYNMTQELAYMVYELDETIDYANKVAVANPKSKKKATVLTNDLNALKETLVITTGDNYVGSAEDQLREKISNLYSVIVSNFDRPSNSQLANLKVITKRFNEAKEEFSRIKNKQVGKLEKSAFSVQMEGLKVKSFDDFVD